MQTSTLTVGTVLKSPTMEYRIERILGAGSFGITYLASSKVKHGNVSFNVKFAIKEHFMDSCYRDSDGIFVHCTPTSQKNVEQSRRDFLNEARRLQNICQQSVNIVHVNEAFEANGTAYYVMEYLDGGSPKPMKEKHAVALIGQIAEAVGVLHKNKLLHLDIKPDNIVLKNADDGTAYPVLIDFGITKHFDDKGNPTSSPNAKGISQGYAPIEQNDDIKTFSPTLDIYALGATLLYLLTGKNPPSSVKLIDPSQRDLNALIPESVSGSTRQAILNAMKPNKNDRTQNVESFLNDLKAERETIIYNDGGTEPIFRKEKPTNPTADTSDVKFGPSYWVFFLSIILAGVGFWFFDSSLFMTSLLCLGGFAAAIALCYFISSRFNSNGVWLYSIAILGFVITCWALDAMSILYTTLGVIVLLTVLFCVFGADKNFWRWIASIALLGAAGLFGYDTISSPSISADHDKSQTTEEIVPYRK